MSRNPDLRTRTNAAGGAASRDAGLLRIRALTRGAAVTAAVGSVAIGLALSHPAQSQAAAPATGSGQTAGTNGKQEAPAPAAVPAPDPNDNQPSQLAAPPQPPANAPQAPPAAVSGGS